VCVCVYFWGARGCLFVVIRWAATAKATAAKGFNYILNRKFMKQVFRFLFSWVWFGSSSSFGSVQLGSVRVCYAFAPIVAMCVLSTNCLQAYISYAPSLSLSLSLTLSTSVSLSFSLYRSLLCLFFGHNDWDVDWRYVNQTTHKICERDTMPFNWIIDKQIKLFLPISRERAVYVITSIHILLNIQQHLFIFLSNSHLINSFNLILMTRGCKRLWFFQLKIVA